MHQRSRYIFNQQNQFSFIGPTVLFFFSLHYLFAEIIFKIKTINSKNYYFNMEYKYILLLFVIIEYKNFIKHNIKIKFIFYSLYFSKAQSWICEFEEYLNSTIIKHLSIYTTAVPIVHFLIKFVFNFDPAVQSQITSRCFFNCDPSITWYFNFYSFTNLFATLHRNRADRSRCFTFDSGKKTFASVPWTAKECIGCNLRKSFYKIKVFWLYLSIYRRYIFLKKILVSQ